MNGNTPAAKLVLLDGHGIIHRAYWGNRDHPLSVRRTGEVVTAVFGFANTLMTVLKNLQPTHIAVAMDTPVPTFRHQRDETYKAHRPPLPEDLRGQFKRVRDVIHAFNIPIYECDGFEADDVLGTLALQAQAQGVETYLVTLDSDICQLVRPGVFCFMYRLFQRDTVIYDTDGVIERYGVRPDQIPDLKGLKGDTSDNIPGVPGIGEKTAIKLVQGFGGVKQIFEQLEDVTPVKLRELLRTHREQAEASREMARIVTDAPCDLSLDRCVMNDFDHREVEDLFYQLEFRSLLPRLNELSGRPVPQVAAPQKPEQPATVEYRVVTTLEELDRIIADIRATGRLAFDTETTSLNAIEAQLVGISLSARPGQAVYIPVGHMPSLGGPEQLAVERVIDLLRPLFSDPAIHKVAHNAKYDMIVLANYGLAIEQIDADTMIAAYLLGDREIGLKSLAREILGVQMTQISELIGTGNKQISMSQVPIESAGQYAAADADLTGRIEAPIDEEVRERGLFDIYRDIELPLVRVLLDMEMTGVAVDVEVLRDMSRLVTDDLRKTEQEICDSVGHSFNMGSPKQLSQVLFEELGLPKTRKTTQGFSTDAQSLEGLRGQHPVIDQILEYRQLSKLKSTYLDALPGMINPRTGRVHTSYNQTTAATGRLSSVDPNLQNIPVRTELGRRVRRAFVARDRQGGGRPTSFLAADYSQVELRILAHISQEPRLLEAFRADEDIHKATAADIFGVAVPDVTPDQRRLAKTVNFAVIYGLSAQGLSWRTELTRGEAVSFIEQYFQRYPGIKRYLDDTVNDTRRQGYAATLLGRRRYLPDINSTTFNLRQAAERMAMNHPIQGTNADIIKIAMNRIYRDLQGRDLASKMILQVHDELIFECPDDELETMRKLAIDHMCSAAELSVPLKVDTKSGKNWGELE